MLSLFCLLFSWDVKVRSAAAPKKIFIYSAVVRKGIGLYLYDDDELALSFDLFK